VDELRALLAYELANGGQVSIINRLDRETSGLTLVAKTSRSRALFFHADDDAFLHEGISRDRLWLAAAKTHGK
jgi:23S rRNA pseudouridine1911/1915/1917 synthase